MNFLTLLDCEMEEKASKPKKYFKFLGIVIAVMGLGAFPCFIMEEAMQTAMFGAFAYNTADDYYGLQNHISIMKSTATTAKVVIYSIGWLSPLTYPAYISYLKNNDAYIRAQESVVNRKLKRGVK